jgi:hypothetical protein
MQPTAFETQCHYTQRQRIIALRQEEDIKGGVEEGGNDIRGNLIAIAYCVPELPDRSPLRETSNYCASATLSVFFLRD